MELRNKAARAAKTAVRSWIDKPFYLIELSWLLSSDHDRAVAVLTCRGSYSLRKDIKKAAYIDSLD